MLAVEGGQPVELLVAGEVALVLERLLAHLALPHPLLHPRRTRHHVVTLVGVQGAHLSK